MLPQSSYSPAKNRNNELAKGHSPRAGILATATGDVVTGRFCSKNKKATHQESSSILMRKITRTALGQTQPPTAMLITNNTQHWYKADKYAGHNAIMAEQNKR